MLRRTVKMDFINCTRAVVLAMLLFVEDVWCLTLNPSKSSSNAILGTNQFELACSYTLDTGDSFLSMTLNKKQQGENSFQRIISFPGPNVGSNASYVGPGGDLENRTTATVPTANDPSARLVFHEIQCDDKAEYLWEASYYNTEPKSMNVTISFAVQVNSRFEESGVLIYPSDTDITQNEEVTFTCTGDVGNEPIGKLAWFYYLNNDTSFPYNETDSAFGEKTEYNSDTCSFTQESKLKLTMVKQFNNILVRCTMSQFKYDQFGEGHKQTSNIPVYYSPTISLIEKKPNLLSYYEGTESVTLKCIGDGNPEPIYHWVLPDNSTSMGQSVIISNLTVEDSGSYTCFANNTVSGSSHEVNMSIELEISPTPPPSTSTTPSSTDASSPANSTPSPSRQDPADSQTTTIIIVVVVVVVVIVIVIIVVLVYIKTKRKPKEIEEPPEKPRNNQGLFYGNRPDLVSADHNAKNNMGPGGLNSSFNNSFDSSSDTKPRNDDGLLYIDLQFENKPGSRRPIQLVDNMGGGNTPYADIVNPRV